MEEYVMLMKAARLRDVDRTYYIHQQAFANLRVKATRRAGRHKSRPVYTRFNRFYDHKAEVDKVMGKKSKFDGLKKHLNATKGEADGG